MSHVLTADMTVSEGKLVFVDEFRYRLLVARRVKQWGDGADLAFRLEPKPEARRRSQDKYWFGYVLKPLVQYTGDPDWPMLLKGMFLEDGQTSIKDLSYEEMADLILKAEAWTRIAIPQAYEQYGREYLG